MKVVLIRPPHHHMITTNVPKAVDTETGMYPPLGLLYVAAGLKAWTDAEVELLDTPALGLDQDGIGRHIARARPDGCKHNTVMLLFFYPRTDSTGKYPSGAVIRTIDRVRFQRWSERV